MAARPSAVATLKFIEHWSHHTAIRAHCIHADRNDDLTFSHSADLTIVRWPETAVRHLHVARLRVRARSSWLFLFGDFSLIGLGAPFPLSRELPLLGERSFDPLFALPDGPLTRRLDAPVAGVVIALLLLLELLDHALRFFQLFP